MAEASNDGATAMSGPLPRDAEPGLRFDLTVRVTREPARDTDGMSAPRAYLRLGLDHRFRLESIRQISPTENDLTVRQLPQDGGLVDIPLLAGAEETRDYLVDLRVDPAVLLDGEIWAARIELVADLPHETSASRGSITRVDLLISDTGSASHSAVHSVVRLSSASSDGRSLADADHADLVWRTCPRGHVTVASVVRFCEEEGCGYEFSDEPGGPGT
jgi:hypothetical protein